VGPRQYGFDRTYGYLHGQIAPYTHKYKNGDRTWHRDDEFLDETGHATDLLAAEAVRWIEAPHRGPFLLYLPFSVPHVPLDEEERWTKPYEGRINDPSRKLYAASVTHMDDAIGRVVQALEKAGLREKTLILFTSDNGGQRNHETGREYSGQYGSYPVLGNNTPLRGWKGDLYEGGIRVPAFVNWPGTLAPRSVEAPLSALDWLPTFAHLTGASPEGKPGWEGNDVWPLLAGTTAHRAPTFYWKTPKESAVRVGDWKLIVSNRDPSKVQLFDLARDPLEKTDRSQQEAGRVAELRDELSRQQRLDR
jgi:arylsulfatase A-like enzyme